MAGNGMYVFDRGVALYYVDPDNGSDTNSGNSPESPMQTIPAAVAKTKIGDWVLLRRGTRFFTHLSLNQPYRYFGTYGQGVKPIIDASTLVPGPWTQHSTYTNVWYADVTLKFSTGGDYSNTRSGAWHPALWDEADTDTNETATVMRRLRNDSGVGASATQEQMIAIVNDEPNTFCVFKQGSSNAEPRNASELGKDWRVYLHTRDGSDPNDNGRMVRLAEDQWALVAGEGQRWHDIVFQRSGGKDMVGVHTGTTKAEIFKGCDFLEAAVHGSVVGGVTFEDCRAVAHKGHTDARSQGGGGYHQYRGVGDGMGFQIRRCYAEGFSHAIYTHGGPDPHHEYYDIDGLTVFRCNNVFQGTSRRHVTARNVKAIECNNLANSDIYIENSEVQITGYLAGYTEASSGKVHLKNCFVAGGERLLNPITSGVFDDETKRPTLVLEDSTLYTSTGLTNIPDAGASRKYNIELRNSIVAGFQIPIGVWKSDSVSIFQPNSGWLTDLAKLGHLQTVEWEITEDDVVWINNPNNRRATWGGEDNGDGTAYITLNSNDRRFGSWIKIPDGNGPGQDYQGRILNNGDSSSDPILVSPVPESTFSSVIFQIPVFKHYLHRDSVSGVLSTDGTQIRVDEPRSFHAGNAIRVSFDWEDNPQLRYIESVVGNVITLTSPLSWQVPGDNIMYNSLDGTTTTNRRPLPTVTITHGFPIIKRNNSGLEYPKITVLDSEGDEIFAIQQGASTTGNFPNAGTGPTPTLFTSYLPDGSARPTPSYNGGIQHEKGYWDLGLAGMGIGDTVRFEFKVMIAEEQVRFAVDPAKTLRYVPHPSSLPLTRGIGFKG